ncbi:uncharacterized protein involved in stress response [Desulfoscipio gibsoniae DSM 7213]|uniref:Uncharacterized protein involved in stress response n=1 Tax=Desulfoscipio gibsoniae DSM 7213 TaxID=767817 RepID=R4KBG2_9FIRM|nr:uncharacterized protein involved in stress response [Desulfoscipio gibsoniae DSM 7213]
MPLTVKGGQKTDLTKNHPGLAEVMVALGWETDAVAIEIDAAAFMLQGNGQCRGDEDFIFYGNPTGRGGAVTVETVRVPDKACIKINLPAVPADVAKIAFTLTIYEGPQRGHTFGQVPGAYIRVADTGNHELIKFNMDGGFSAETAIVVAELYRHQGQWKFNPVAMGYHGGLAALCGSFGIEVADQPDSQTANPKPNQPAQPHNQPVVQPAGQPAGAPLNLAARTTPKQPVNQPGYGGSTNPAAPGSQASKPSGQRINLSKIELKKKGDKINLEKKANNKLGEILVNLNWNQQKQPKQSTGLLGSLFGGGGGGVDLDLGCLIDMKNGQKSVIQALGKAFGSYHSFPYIALDGDDRTGAVAGGENLRINGDHIADFNRILVFAYIYEGVPNWAQADGVVTIKQPGGPDIEVRLDEHDKRKIMCAIALIENVNNETLSVERQVRYFSGHREMDSAYNWGLRWKADSK